jgi:hypothetical protein
MELAHDVFSIFYTASAASNGYTIDIVYKSHCRKIWNIRKFITDKYTHKTNEFRVIYRLTDKNRPYEFF